VTTGRPAILVLLATYQGMPFLPDQLRTILDQEDVDIRVLVSDDGSTDGTLEHLHGVAATDERVRMLPGIAPSGSSSANFARLIRDADPAEHELIAFADQDDLWAPRKLVIQAAAIADGADAVSGSVMAFREDGTRFLVKKDYPQRRFDYLTESPGPGCSFLMTPGFVALAASVLDTVPSAATADFHDSLLYAIGRGAALRWRIIGEPLVQYRQHESNVLGANRGAHAARGRFAMLRSRWHRRQAQIHAEAAIAVAHPADRDALVEMLRLLTSSGFRDRLALVRRAGQLRRRPRDRVILGATILLGLW
jgi:rhamnosyltransferase